MPKDHFRKIAGYYDRMGEFEPSKKFLQNLDLQPNCSLLDAGGGTGRVATVFREEARQVVVADLSFAMIGYAKEKGLLSACASAEALPFPANTFDRVIMVDAFHHLADQVLAAAELWRVLKPGGKLLILEPNIHRFGIKLLSLGEKLLLTPSNIMTYEAISGLFNDPAAKVSHYKEESDVAIIIEKVKQL